MKKRIISLFLIFSLLCSFWIFAEVQGVSAETAPEIGVLKGGGFETNSLWDNDARVKNDNAFEGEYVVTSPSNGQGRKLSKEFTLNKSSNYILSFWYKNPKYNEKTSARELGDSFLVMQGSSVFASAEIKETAEWKHGLLKFNTGSYDKFKLGISGIELFVDAVSLTETKVGNYISDYSFEEEASVWTPINSAILPVTDKMAKSGFVSKKITAGENSGIYCDVEIPKGLQLEFSFSYIGGGANAWYGVADTKSTLDAPKLFSEKKTFETVSEWTNAKVTFESKKTTARVIIFLGNNGELKIDDISLTLDGSKNLVSNSSFESGVSDWINNYSQKCTVKTGVANTGNNSMNLAQYRYAKSYKKINVTPNKDYYLCFAHKNSDGSQWAIADGELSIPCVNSGEKGFIIGGNITGSSNGWTLLPKVFNSGDSTSVWIAFQSASATNSTLIDDVYLCETSFVSEKMLLDNGDFESGFDGWSQRWSGSHFTISNEAKSGHNALKIITGSGYPKIGHTFNVTAGKTYVMMFSFKGNCNWAKWSISKAGATAEETLVFETGSKNFVMGGSLTYNTTEWQTFRSDPFTPDSDGQYSANFQTNGNKGLSVLIDDVLILEYEDDSMLLNGDFNGTLSGWDYNEDYTELSDDAKNGANSAALYSGNHKKLSQKINVQKNTKYELSFFYKGTVPSGRAAYALSPSTSFDDNCPVKAQLSDKSEWTEVKTVFDSGDNEGLYVLFQTMDGCEYLVDSVKICESTSSAPAQKEIKKALFGGTVTKTPYNDCPYICKDADNLIKNYGFEGNKTGDIGDALNITDNNSTVVNDPEIAFEGNKSIKFTAGEQEAVSEFRLPVKKNKTYWLSLFVKSEGYTGEKNFATFGVTEPDEGNFLLYDNPTSEAHRTITKTVQMIPTALDNEWHLISFEFFTNDMDNLYFTIRGTNTVIYIDNMYLFEDGKGIQYKAPIEKLADVSVTDNSPALLEVNNQSNNLLKNYTLNEGNNFWSETRGTAFGDSLNVVDSKHTVQEKTLYYESPRKHPYKLYYIKWIDVKPNTEYTFSGKYCITKTGDGFVGIISGENAGISLLSENQLYPTLIKKFGYTDNEFDYNCNWQNMGVSFNTNGRNRVGIVVFDGGGEAYIDDLRLFETKNGVKLTEKPDNFPTAITPVNNKLSVKGGNIFGCNPSVKLKDLLSGFEDSKFLRVYDSLGEEITDLSKTVATGMEIRLMNGPVIKDRATIVIKGDVNGDGLLNADDISCVLDHISRKKLLKNSYLSAADFDGDGEITVFDIMRKASKYKTGKNTLSVSGPKSFEYGQKITLKLSLSTNNILALSGKLSFATDAYTLSGIKALGGSSISYLANRNEVLFAVSSEKPLSGKDILSFDLTVGEVSTYDEAYVQFSDVVSTDGTTLFSSDSLVWVAQKKEQPKTDEEEYEEYEEYIEEEQNGGADEENIIKKNLSDDEEYEEYYEYYDDSETEEEYETDDDEGGKKIIKKIIKKRRKKKAAAPKENSLILYLIIGGAVLLTTAAALTVILIIKKKKKSKQN